MKAGQKSKIQNPKSKTNKKIKNKKVTIKNFGFEIYSIEFEHWQLFESWDFGF